MGQGEGAQVRHAMNGPDIEHDALIAFAAARNREDAKRASSAGESRQEIGTFLEETGMNGKALSWMRQVLKVADKDEDKARDIIRSLDKALPMIREHVTGQTTPDMFGEGDAVEPLQDGEALPRDPGMQAETDDFDRHLAQVVPFTAGR